MLWRRVAVAVAAIALVAVALGFAFAGSPATLPTGVHIAGVPVGGLTPGAARATLQQRARALGNRAVTFTAAGRSWKLSPSQLGVSVNWNAAVVTALSEADGPAPVRGFYRLGVRIFGTDITPSAQAYNAALEFELRRMATAVDKPHREASIRLQGQTPVVVPSQTGRILDREAAARTIVQSLALLARPAQVALPVKVDAPTVTAADLQPVAAQVRLAVSAPVRLAIGPTRFRLPRYRIAEMLDPPSGGRRDLRVAGPGADAFFVRLQRQIGHVPRDADFAVTSHGIRVVPARAGRDVDIPATAAAILPPRCRRRTASRASSPSTAPPKVHDRRRAKAMGIKDLVGSYTTEFGGVPNRIHNVQLVAHLIDNHLIAPGEKFSFNRRPVTATRRRASSRRR